MTPDQWKADNGKLGPVASAPMLVHPHIAQVIVNEMTPAQLRELAIWWWESITDFKELSLRN
ncbi:MAG TPA: hypothetical protein VK457_05420 [Chloroflexota bacterium]|nr:hypothetical protein [Chloroflexota bacterium]